MSDDLNNQDEPDEAVGMLAHDMQNNIGAHHADARLSNGSSGHTLAEQVCFFYLLIK